MPGCFAQVEKPFVPGSMLPFGEDFYVRAEKHYLSAFTRCNFPSVNISDYLFDGNSLEPVPL